MFPFWEQTPNNYAESDGMRVYSKKALRWFWEVHPDSEVPLRTWLKEAKRVTWNSPIDVKNRYSDASIIDGTHVVFNIGGNKYRLTVQFNFKYWIIYILHVETHSAYDRRLKGR